MAEPFYLKKGDTRPFLDYTLLVSVDGADPVAITDDLTGATINFHFKPAEGAGSTVTVAGTIQSNTTKTVRATIATNTFDAYTSRTKFKYEVEVTLSGGAVLTFPTVGHESLILETDLD